MDISCIISSGDIELYVLGLLPVEDANKMEQLISMFPELRQEADRISETLEAVAAASTLSPQPTVKDKLFTALAEIKPEPVLSTPVQNKESGNGNQSGDLSAPVVSIRKNRTKLLLAASFVGLVLCIGALFYLSQKKNKEMAALQDQLDAARKDLSGQQQQNVAYSQLVDIMLNEDFTGIHLETVPGKPAATAQVYWNKKTREVYLVDISLPQAPSDKQYQLWAIVDGQPVNAGMLQDSKQQAQKMQDFKEADAFAITLEKRGGSATPTLQEMYVMGKAS